VSVAKGYRGWYIPEDATVEVDGEIVPVPVFTESARKGIIDYSHQPKKPFPFILDRWLTRCTDIELQALRHYFSDRWLWDTGCDYDKCANMVVEREIEHRKVSKDFGKKLHGDIAKAFRVPSHML